MRMFPFGLVSLASITLSAIPAFAVSEADLRATLEQRFKGDRTGACVAAAVIDNGATASAHYCADPNSQRRYDEHTAFEIGSVTKTMTAALLAEFIARGEVALNDPIAKLLPPGTSVPSFDGRQITIGQIVTHTSGLPAVPTHYRMTDINNPYASVSQRPIGSATAAWAAPATETSPTVGSMSRGRFQPETVRPLVVATTAPKQNDHHDRCEVASDACRDQEPVERRAAGSPGRGDDGGAWRGQGRADRGSAWTRS